MAHARTPGAWLHLLVFAAAVATGRLSAVDAAVSNPPPFNVATFEADVTIPIGHACMGGGIADAARIEDKLLAKGLVLLGDDKPIVLLSIDWCQLNNDAFDRWREVIADAAGTVRNRVMLSTVHQHDAPICDLRAQALLDRHGMRNSICDPVFHEQAVQRTASALRTSLKSPTAITHFGIGSARVEKVASNRHVVVDGRASWARMSADTVYQAHPEGQIDPMLKTFSFWAGERPVVAWSSYSVHPMSHYGKASVSADFVGLARAKRQADDPSVFQIYFTGCAGDTVAGKYNQGRPDERGLLSERLYQGMKAAWAATKRLPLDSVTFRSAELKLPIRIDGDFAPAALERILSDPAENRWRRNRAALGLSWRERSLAHRPIDVPCLSLGKQSDARFLVLPAETFVGYQLKAQEFCPASAVMVAGFGDGAPGYLPTDACYAEGWQDHYSWVHPGFESTMLAAMKSAIGLPHGDE